MALQNSEPFPSVEPHGDLTQIIDDVWYLPGSVAFKPLLRLPRNMVVIRHQGELTLVNSVRLDDAGEKALEALGKVSHIMKIGFHGMDDAYYLDRYDARHWVVDRNSTDNNNDDIGKLDEGVELPFPDARLFAFKDTINPEVCILIERDGGLLITSDCVQHWVPSNLMSPVAKVMTRLIGFQKPAQIGPPWKKMQTPPNKSLRADFDRLAALPFERIIGGHGGLLESKGAELLKATIQRELA